MCFIDHFSALDDPRKNINIRYDFQYRAYQHGIPVDDTIARLIRAIEPEKMNQAFIDWVNEVRQEQGHERQEMRVTY